MHVGSTVLVMRDRVATYLPQLILLANAGAFAVLLAELLIMDHTDGIQRLAPLTAALGIALCTVAIFLPARARFVPAVLLVVLSGAGLIGFIRHMDEREDGFSGLFQSSDDRDDNSGRGNSDDRDRDDDDDEEPPPLAPLGLSGTALLSAIAAFAGTPSTRRNNG